MTDANPLLITVKAAADKLSLTPWSVYRLLDSGELKGKYQGRRRYVDYESLVTYKDNLPDLPQAG